MNLYYFRHHKVAHDMARSKAFRWGEEGIGGISDDKQQICFAWAFWNHADSILKERFFGLTGRESNHGEDVKELYYYLAFLMKINTLIFLLNMLKLPPTTSC